MGTDALRQALDLSLAAHDAALAGDADRVLALLDERTPLLERIDIPLAEVENARAILVQIQRLDTSVATVLADLRREIERERAELRRAGRARAAYRSAATSTGLNRAG
ncbi:MAG: hypothetical protein KatS3mg060_2775 [Dehalococcoidia bacterium]|nr:MAG: hypothetical protein KatS3mg060_2775 [Dehalococcoidia bacterium]